MAFLAIPHHNCTKSIFLSGRKLAPMTQKIPQPRHDEVRFTQNFLHSPALVDRIVKLADLKAGTTVLEIGPGKGIITKRLAEAVGTTGKVVAVELDAGLATRLVEQFRPMPQVTILTADILEVDLTTLPTNYAVFSNVPFNITSALLEMLLRPVHGPAQAHLILQREALIGATEYGAQTETFKSMMIAPLYALTVAHTFQKSDFAPQPSVDTALFAFEKRPTPLIDPARYDLYKDFLAAASKDRVGEGIWRKLFSLTQLNALAAQAGLVIGRGLKSQQIAAMIAAFMVFSRDNRPKHGAVTGAMGALREEQTRRESINRTGGHRRPAPPPKNPRR